jgi:hypothetical protein
MALHKTENERPGFEELRRRFQSVPVHLSGRFMLESRQEYPCQTEAMSPFEIVLFSPATAMIGERVILYLDEVGRFAGVCFSRTETGFSLKIDLPDEKREQLADKLIWFANRDALRMSDNRRHERIIPLMQRAIMRLPEGREVIVRILDLSISGVGVASSTRPPVGEHIVIGSRPAVVTRHFPEGFGAEFERQFAVGELDESTRL